ncbi:MAG: translation elongation factor Ts [Spirochaetaceae bacterium]|nr:translation elongation factor Ts [Spirochaetaceae bacterium]
MEIKPTDVKKLRDKTGAGMMDCKTALTEASGDFDKAVKILKEKGLAAAAKRSSRATQEGKIFTKISEGKAVILELSCETDFVARNENFIKLGKELAEEIIASGADTVNEKLSGMVTTAISVLKENMTLKRFKTLLVANNEYAVDYIHGEGNIGTIIKLRAENPEVFKKDVVKTLAVDLTLHAAAFAPMALSEKDISETYMKEQEDIFRKQSENLNKPENVLQGIIKGKISKHLSEICFLNQPFVKDDKRKVSQVLADISKEAGSKIELLSYLYYKLGENA